MRFPVEHITDIALNDKQAHEIYRALCTLADDLNASLLQYEVTLEHFDTVDYLCFRPRSAEEIEDIKEYMEANAAMTA